ncbi:MAG: GntR family transcriptional regulator [Alphaproteobacteria bacterium]
MPEATESKPSDAPAARPRKPGSRAPMSRRAYEAVKRRILDNDIPGGAHVLEEELAQMLGMSRTPIREALVQLEKDGLIELVPRRGMRVLALSPDDIRHVYDLLQCLESHAAALAARHRDHRRIAARLDAPIGGMRAALEADDLRGWAEANERFHRTLVDSCGNPRLAQMAYTLLDQSHRVRTFTVRLRARPVRSTDNHAATVDAIRDGDPGRAAGIHEAHKGEWMVEMDRLMAEFNIKML